MFEFYSVGGIVRDDLLGRPSADLDVCAVPVEAGTLSTVTLFKYLSDHVRDLGFAVFDEQLQFFTIRGTHSGDVKGFEGFPQVDFVMARKDGPSSDGRHPDYVLPGTLLDDLSRRDFTVNAMARNFQTGELVDPFGGAEDLRAGIIKFVGDPIQRIKEDGLRVMRALRFCVTHNMKLHPDTRAAIDSDVAIGMLLRVNPNRIFNEVKKMFDADFIAAMDFLAGESDQHKVAIFRDNLRITPSMKKAPGQ
ncbi:tRNA nucleotidyltransferase/poly (A) polymerase [Synechococcus phage S-CBWM1]|uniref:tRNA nucleotidyltransferase/poly (A) polymerase n=1 Tax=Synechococcus phage S-CBWM1 TaxID=2053653 RepID=A0A3G1L3D7_9CAUD|nr:tRNA nucleotidyltransferase [Synechococcus phage S-CBWM1]ATW62701.1 tRNA nucleotidyltransferase/poly (A) polymerase [Synechococcus phage S-CBWM1]